MIGRMRVALVLVQFVLLLAPAAARQAPSPAGVELLHRSFDQILDLNVRDGLVYYRALKSERGRLDRYVASLNVPAAAYQGWSKSQQLAFWIDAYNAFVIETVINHYPIRGTSSAYPSNSIRQIPGAFDRVTWRAAGRSVTLDQIENTILPEFNEPRAFLALGRGAAGSSRLRSEAYTADRLESQLASVQTEFVATPDMLRIDRTAGRVLVTPIVSWHDQAFIAAYDHLSGNGDAIFASRSPIERAIIMFIRPNLLPLEKEFLQNNQFEVRFHDMDWHLNDLTGRS
jgi:hypothetical protein